MIESIPMDTGHLWTRFMRFDINNGITLCKRCHNKIFGKEKEFIKYFKSKLNSKNG